MVGLALVLALCCVGVAWGSPRVLGTVSTRSIQSGERESFTPTVITREAAFLGSQPNQETPTNCHLTSISKLAQTETIKEHISKAQITAHAAQDEDVSFCYFRFFADSFTRVGTLHRPARSQPQLRSSFDEAAGDMAKFGLASSFQTSNCFTFGDPNDSDFVDIQGYTLTAVHGKPFVRISGWLNGTTNTRPTTENQIVEWKILFSPTGDVDKTTTLRSGTFTIFRASKENPTSHFIEGTPELEPVHLQGFESGWIGLWMRVRFVELKQLESGARGSVSICDSGLIFEFSEPPHPQAYSAAKQAALEPTEDVEPASVSATKKEETATPPTVARREDPVSVFDFSTGSLNNQVKGATDQLIDIGKDCGMESRFVNDIVLGKEQKVLRFERGPGVAIPDVLDKTGGSTETEFTLMMLVKLERTSCYVRILNVNPGEDGGLYLCDGIQLTPEVPAGHALAAMEYHHIAISTKADRDTRLYHNGRLLKAWKPGRNSWRNSLMLQSPNIVLFNDCGLTCKCESVESSGGWLASVTLINSAVDNDAVEEAYNNHVATGLVADYDLTKGSLESIVDSAADMADIGATCHSHATFVKDGSLEGVATNQILRVQQRAGLSVPVEGVVPTQAQTRFTIIAKVKFDSVGCSGSLLTPNPTKASTGIKVCERLQLASRSFGPRLQPHTWYSVAISTEPNFKTNVFVDGTLVYTAKLTATQWKTHLKLTGDSLVLFGSSTECTDPSTDAVVSVSRVMLFDRALTYSEVQYHTGKLGLEIKVTLDPKVAGGTAPTGSVCSFPYVLDGQTYHDCSEAINRCKTSGDILEDGNNQFEWGFCAEGAGYIPHPGKSVSSLYDIADCRGGVLGCQQSCNSISDCVGFVIDECAHPSVQASLLEPFGKSTFVYADGFRTIRAGEGNNNGAAIQSVGLQQGKQYIWRVRGAAQRDRLAMLFVQFPGGAQITGPFLDASTTSSEFSLQFTAAAASATVGVRFVENCSPADAFHVEAVDLPTMECDGKTGVMAVGHLKSLLGPMEGISGKTLYQKMRMGPVLHVDTAGLGNLIRVSQSVSNLTKSGSVLTEVEDFGESCIAHNAAEDVDMGGVGGSDVAGFSIQLDTKFSSGTELDEQMSMQMCLAKCSASKTCVGVTWVRSSATCSLATSVTTASSSGAVAAYRRSSKVQYIRFVQQGSTTGPWQVSNLAVFNSPGLQNAVEQTYKTLSTDGSEIATVTGDPDKTWTAKSGNQGESLTLQFVAKTSPIVSVFIKSATNWPSSILVQESLDGKSWWHVAYLDAVTTAFSANVIGTGGGVGGDQRKVFRFAQGTGLGVSGVCDGLLCGEDASYTVVMGLSVEDEQPTAILVAPNENSKDGLVLQGSHVSVSGGDAAPVGSTRVAPWRWNTVALSVGRAQSRIIAANGNADIFAQISAGAATASTPTDLLRLFNNWDGEDRCSSTSKPMVSGLLSHFTVFNRALSAGELADVMDGMRTRCPGSLEECSDHGACVDGMCVCQRTEASGWKGPECAQKACPGVPECNGRGKCDGNGKCTCDASYYGTACELLKCPGVGALCSGHGTCESSWEKASCKCDAGFRGDDCSLRICPGDYENSSGERIDCSGNGVCNTATGQCTCAWNAVSDVAGYRIVEVCEGGSVTLACDSGFISIWTASYGRSDTSSCGSSSVRDCLSSIAMPVTLNTCDGKERCTVNAYNALFGDPCVGVGKQLRISYSCVSSAGTREISATDCSLAIPID